MDQEGDSIRDILDIRGIFVTLFWCIYFTFCSCFMLKLFVRRVGVGLSNGYIFTSFFFYKNVLSSTVTFKVFFLEIYLKWNKLLLVEAIVQCRPKRVICFPLYALLIQLQQSLKFWCETYTAVQQQEFLLSSFSGILSERLV